MPRSRTVAGAALRAALQAARAAAIAAGLVVALVAAVLVFAPVPVLAGFVPSFSGVVKATQPAVVTVRIALPPGRARIADGPPEESGGGIGDFLDRLFGDGSRGDRSPQDRAPGHPLPPGQALPPGALASGFIIDPAGIIVTNYHVVEGSDEITVVLNDGTELDATRIGADDKTDIAVLRVRAGRPLPSVDWGDSDAVEVGDWAIAIGNPFGLGGSVSAGIISARGRDIHSGPYDDYFQIDAPINRGNSGGPLFNLDGEVVGVNSAIISPSGASVGIGFAVPASTAQPIVEQILKYGETRRGWIGVRIQTVTPDIAESLGLGPVRGALIAGLTEGGPAAAGGLEPGDVVLAFDGHPISTMRDLPRMVAGTEIGSTVELQIFRDGETLTRRVDVARLEDDVETWPDVSP